MERMVAASIHVVPRGDNWVVTREGGDDLLSDLSEDEAIDVGREIARLDRVAFIIYHDDGTIREQYSYKELGDRYP